jgi:hypothetical protein
MNPVTAAVLKSGLISQAQLAEMKRFSPTIDQEAEVGEPVSLEVAAQLLEEAFQSEQYVLVRETDLEVVRKYAETAKSGMLHVEVSEEQKADIEVTYGKTTLGAYIIAWKSESIAEALTNGLTYLVEGSTKVFFKEVRELFFGEQKAFMICVPSSVEPHDHG